MVTRLALMLQVETHKTAALGIQIQQKIRDFQPVHFIIQLPFQIAQCAEFN